MDFAQASSYAERASIKIKMWN